MADEDDPDFLYATFPAGFQWGFATASYQIEGGWNADGKGVNIWDTFTREEGKILDGSNGDIACDSYHRFEEDIQLLKDIGAKCYRFSLSWSRILSNGTIDSLNQAGLDYYNRVINSLIENDIVPLVTLYHWDLPQYLQDIGGWPSEELVEHFANYARLVFKTFGDRVKLWITFNEPQVVCTSGYSSGSHAPGIKEPTTLPYLCAHTILNSHAKAYRIYEIEFKDIQGGKVGITLNTDWFEPHTQDFEDVDASERAMQFQFGWFASPVFYGKYPDVMRKFVDLRSKEEGLPKSRLPEFDEESSLQVKGSWDFIGLNHYTSRYVKNADPGPPGFRGDQNNVQIVDPKWETAASSWLKNGFSDDISVGLNDTRRANYYRQYINNLLKAVVLDGCNVAGYTAWSLIDNFEWSQGYTERFGVHSVDFSDPKRPRTPKGSAKTLSKIFAENGFRKH